MKKIIYIIITTIMISMIFTACGNSSNDTDKNTGDANKNTSDTKKDTDDPSKDTTERENKEQRGVISGAVGGFEGDENVIVVLYDNEDHKENENMIKVSVGRENNWKYNIKVPYGEYMACAFIDVNKDETLTFGETFGCNDSMAEISEETNRAERNIKIPTN